ncbi:MAG TPA: phytanoyl-CoA dioxygenase family protein [Steroidobacteraceae bacterium]|nr:phytanoyl-CoA dioxygenase family protein [Steroidobacteraceae bacterium]
MDATQLAAQFWRDGYLVLEDFFRPSVMDRLDRLIRRRFGADPAFWHNEEFLTKARTEVIPWFPQQEGVAEFDDLEAAAGFKGLTDAILGSGWQRLYCMVMFSKPGTAGQAWHQDCAPEDPAIHNLNRLVYTSDVGPLDGGQTVVVRGSHRHGLLPAGDPEVRFDDEVVLTPTKGMVVFLHGHTWHRVLPVRGAARVSTNYRAMPAGTPESITDVCVYRNMRYCFSTSSVVEER